jgi:hypothetical protein
LARPAGHAPNRGPSLRRVAAELAARGYLTGSGRPYSRRLCNRCLRVRRRATCNGISFKFRSSSQRLPATFIGIGFRKRT